MGTSHLRVPSTGLSMKLALVALLFIIPACFAQGKAKGSGNDLVVTFEELFSQYLNNTQIINELQYAMDYYWNNCAFGPGKGCYRKGKGGKGKAKKSNKKKKGKNSKKNNKSKKSKKGKKNKKKGKQPPISCPEVEDVMQLSGEARHVLSYMGWADDYDFNVDEMLNTMCSTSLCDMTFYVIGHYSLCLPDTAPTVQDAVGSRCAGSYNATEAEMITNATTLQTQYGCILEAFYDSPAVAQYVKFFYLGIKDADYYDNYDSYNDYWNQDIYNWN